VPKSNLFKIGVATAAAAVCAILAFTSVFAHTTPPTTGRSIVGTIVNAATNAGLVADDPALNGLTNEQDQDAIEAAALAAKIAAEQAKLAAELAAQKAEEAAEAAPNACVATDQAEDTAEQAADQTEDAAEKTNGTESASEDTAEMTARQATDKPEDTSEVKCAVAEGDHHADGDTKEGSTTTFSSEGDH
jgi:metal-dependent amidase/aminoacylase/carboxypeptidase family protein